MSHSCNKRDGISLQRKLLLLQLMVARYITIAQDNSLHEVIGSG